MRQQKKQPYCSPLLEVTKVKFISNIKILFLTYDCGSILNYQLNFALIFKYQKRKTESKIVSRIEMATKCPGQERGGVAIKSVDLVVEHHIMMA